MKKQKIEKKISPIEHDIDKAAYMLLKSLSDEELGQQEIEEVKVTFRRGMKFYEGTLIGRIKLKDSWLYQVECEVNKTTYHRFCNIESIRLCNTTDSITIIQEGTLEFPIENSKTN